MNILKNLNETNEIINILKKGGLVIAPSDTVYGLLVDGNNEEAVAKLKKFKNRPPGKPISVFVADFEMLNNHTYINTYQKSLLKKLLPGPFTIILNSKHKVARQLESEKGTLGVRIPDYPYINNLIQKYGNPITATSANLSGRSPHYSVDSLMNNLPKNKLDLIDLIVDAGQLPRNKPSTIVDLTNSDIKILRQGDIVLKNSQTYISKSPHQTMKIGEFLISQNLKLINNKPLVIIIEGNLGVGKTILVKGMAQKLGINNIISPTYVVYYEYKINKQYLNYFYHFDLYQVEEQNEFKYLGIESYLKPKNILCFEWGEKTGGIINILKNKARVIYVKMEYLSEKERELTVNK